MRRKINCAAVQPSERLQLIIWCCTIKLCSENLSVHHRTREGTVKRIPNYTGYMPEYPREKENQSKYTTIRKATANNWCYTIEREDTCCSENLRVHHGTRGGTEILFKRCPIMKINWLYLANANTRIRQSCRILQLYIYKLLYVNIYI